MSKRPDHFYYQSGVIPFRKRNGKLELLMVTSTRKKRWVIPKGVKERHLSPKESAIKEAWEEAGIRGKVSRSAIGAYRYRKWGGTCTVKVFAMEVRKVVRNWEESFRDRAWFSHREALQRIEHKDLQQIVRQLPDFV
ncbi:MAG: NUDIX hydrolase [Gammaproteobacteria bacterium]|jgi:phosphohistidine phosphatase